MQHIQWFPGHMTKAMRMMENEVKLVDGIICVLDSRAVYACLNEKLEKLFGNKPIVYVLNKMDLIPPADCNRILKDFTSNNKLIVATNGTDKKSTQQIISLVKIALKDKIQKNTQKGVNKTLRVMVTGIPNTGKSTIINSICGNKRAMTGNKAGVTRSKQWVRIEGFDMLDTPGTMPPSFEDQQKAKHLAYIGSINDDILDIEDLCFELIKDLSTISPSSLTEVYKVSDIQKPTLEIFEEICKNRGYLLRGGEYDYTRCARAVIDEFRKGRLGKICLE